MLWLFGLLLLTPACAQAQVRVDPAALRQLQGLPPVPPPSIQPVVVQPRAHKPAWHHKSKPQERPLVEPHATVSPAKPGNPAPASTPAPTPNVTIHTPVLPPTVKITFAPGSAVLPADANAILHPFCQAKNRVPILAYAPATPANPGDSMQLSMQRAFAIRSALISCGVPAQNIIPQSAGGSSGTNSNVALIGTHATP